MTCTASEVNGDRSAATSASARIENALEAALASIRARQGPPRLTEAVLYAVFPGGHRLRPQLAMLVSDACGDGDPATADAAAAAVELVHCASLVHDDLPSFDDADVRRGRPSLHKVCGESLALLAGDSLIVLAFEVLGRATPTKVAPLVRELAEASGAARGIAAGQAWECEHAVDLLEYHRAKTASLFEAAAAMGAIAAGAAPAPWRRMGELVGRAYQAADDVRDALGSPVVLGKPIGRDALLGRPSLVRSDGITGARARVDALVTLAAEAVPPGSHGAHVRGWLERLAEAMRIP